MKIQVAKGKKGWFWQIVAKNGKTLAHSETYSRKRNALETARAVIDCLPGAEIEVVE